jgi:hypothetical protein
MLYSVQIIAAIIMSASRGSTLTMPPEQQRPLSTLLTHAIPQRASPPNIWPLRVLVGLHAPRRTSMRVAFWQLVRGATVPGRVE